MAEPTVQVPVSLVERAMGALLEVPPSSRNADIYGELSALLSYPTQECGVCGRQYPVDDPHGTCPVCWPGFGEHGQQAGTAAEHEADR